jgi:hypothetical protein
MSANNPENKQPASQPQAPPKTQPPAPLTNPVPPKTQPPAPPTNPAPPQPRQATQQTNIQQVMLEEKQRNAAEYAIPPDLDLCKDYRKATMFGIPKPDEHHERELFSNLPLSNCRLRLTAPSQVFARLGNGYYTYFYFLKLLAVLLIFPFFIVTIYEMNSNGQGTKCLKPTEMRDIGQVYEKMQQSKSLKIKGISTGNLEKEKQIQKQEAENLRRSMIGFLAIKCITSWSDTRCKSLRDQGCITHMTGDCVNKTLAFYKDEYPNTICRDSFFTRYTSANREVAEMHEYYIEPKKIIGWVCAIIGMAMIYLFHVRHYEEDEKLDANFTTIQDCSARLINIPKKVPDIINKIKESFREHNIELAQVCLLYDVEEFMSLKREFQQLLVKQAKQRYSEQQKVAATHDAQDSTPLLDRVEKEKTEVMNKIKALEGRFTEGANSTFIGQAYVSFKYSRDRDRCVAKFRPRGWKWKIFHLDPKPTAGENGLKIKNEKGEEQHMNVTSCAEPGDILWENLGYSRINILFRQSLSFLFTALIIVIDFIGIYALKVVGMNLVRTSDGKPVTSSAFTTSQSTPASQWRYSQSTSCCSPFCWVWRSGKRERP